MPRHDVHDGQDVGGQALLRVQGALQGPEAAGPRHVSARVEVQGKSNFKCLNLPLAGWMNGWMDGWVDKYLGATYLRPGFPKVVRVYGEQLNMNNGALAGWRVFSVRKGAT